ncbi:MAG: hypothetical protein JKX73_04080, partial [Flavobacteriales bacterium]|nr:hypothetical protein [Flavobacteriales bacterium]
MKNILIPILLLISNLSFGQNGTFGNPFVTLSQASLVPSNGIYYFNIGGTPFSTYVEAGNGWILIASGEASTTESFYPTTTALSLQSDLILPSSIYASAQITDVRINSTSGPGIPFDVQSSNPTVLSNLQSNLTLTVGTNNTDWTGTGTARLNRVCIGNTGTLATHIYHACGNFTGLHWQIGQFTAHEKIIYNNGTKNDLNLWIRAGCQLPVIDLGNDTAVCQGALFTLDATSPSSSYLWHDFSTNPTYNVTLQGTYSVQVTNSCGTVYDTIIVIYNPLPTTDLGNDTTLCQGQLLTLDATSPTATYLWQNNSTNPTYNVTLQGIYSVQVTNTCGTVADTIVVNYNPLPNTDLGNDTTL